MLVTGMAVVVLISLVWLTLFFFPSFFCFFSCLPVLLLFLGSKCDSVAPPRPLAPSPMRRTNLIKTKKKKKKRTL